MNKKCIKKQLKSTGMVKLRLVYSMANLFYVLLFKSNQSVFIYHFAYLVVTQSAVVFCYCFCCVLAMI